MSRTDRSYRPRDYSQLLQQLQDQHQGSIPLPQQKATAAGPKPAPYVSPLARRRASLMSNRRMRYIISKTAGEKHDRDCPCAAAIPDDAFDMAEDHPGQDRFCRRCSRKAVIREGLHWDLSKHLDAAMILMRKMNASTHLLYTLFHEYGGQILKVDVDSVTLKVREDTWILRHTAEGCLLFHNNYYALEDDTRIITDGFHLQADIPMTFHSAFTTVTGYSWEAHVKRKRAEALAVRQGALRERLATVPNHIRLPRFSFFHTYFLVAEGNRFIMREADRRDLSARLLLRSRYPHTKCTDSVYRIRKKDRKAFLTLLEEAKEQSVNACCFDYADFCQQRITSQAAGRMVNMIG